MDRLTARRNDNGLAYLVGVKPNEQEVESPYPNTLRCILECFQRLAEYEDTGRDPNEIAALDHDVAKLQLTLQEIANPIKFLQQRADEQGGKLNGLFAINLATDAGYLKGLAKKALAEIETKPEPFKPSSYKDSRQMHRIEKEGRA